MKIFFTCGELNPLDQTARLKPNPIVTTDQGETSLELNAQAPFSTCFRDHLGMDQLVFNRSRPSGAPLSILRNRQYNTVPYNNYPGPRPYCGCLATSDTVVSGNRCLESLFSIVHPLQVGHTSVVSLWFFRTTRGNQINNNCRILILLGRPRAKAFFTSQSRYSTEGQDIHQVPAQLSTFPQLLAHQISAVGILKRMQQVDVL